MKFKIRKYKGTVKLKFSEKWYFFKKRLQNIWKGFVEKGHEKMTIMLIPHNEKKIFNFQISKFTISFFLVLFFITVVTSGYAYIRNQSIKREEQRLKMTYDDIRTVLLKFEKTTGKIVSTVDDIKPYVEEIYEIAAGSEEKDHIWSLDKYDPKGFKELQKLKKIMPDEIFTLKKIQKDIVCVTNTLRTVKNFIKVRSAVINHTPSIVPNSGYITSLFGWRRSPFGTGRDFHTGIDIAASEGVDIRATAPGKVVFAGWGDGYGWMIRVKHKYGFETVYAHCRSMPKVKVDDKVYKGQVIAAVGRTGSATGNHCHYEVRLGDVPINPYPYMSRMW